jgi:hypothetical protein
MLIENAGKSKWLKALAEPSLTAFTRLTGPQSAMNTVSFEDVYIGKAKNLVRGLIR